MPVTTEATAAEAFEAADAKRAALQRKIHAARDQVRFLRETIERARSAYRTGLALAELDSGTPMPSRAELTAKEGELVIEEDRLAGLEEADRLFEPQWGQAKQRMLHERASARRMEQAAVQAELTALIAEREAMQQREYELGRRVQELGTEANDLTRQAEALAAKYPA